MDTPYLSKLSIITTVHKHSVRLVGFCVITYTVGSSNSITSLAVILPHYRSDGHYTTAEVACKPSYSALYACLAAWLAMCQGAWHTALALSAKNQPILVIFRTHHPQKTSHWTT